MVETLQFGTNFDPNSTFVDDIYLEVVPPAAYLQGVPTSVGGVVGTASWGPLNVPKLVSNPQQLVSTFGGKVIATDGHDLCWDLSTALNQAGSAAGLSLYGIRVADGSQAQSSLTLLDFEAPGETATLGGSLTSGNAVNLKFTNPNLTKGFYTLQYVVTGGDTTLTILATSIKNAINADSTLIAAGITATSSGAIISFTWPVALGYIGFTASVNGIKTATVGGSATTGNVLALTVHDATLAGGQITVPYTVLITDTTLTLVALGLKNAINATSVLSAAGITATSSGAVISITSLSKEQTTYTADTTGITETITFGGGATETVTYANLSLNGLTLTAKYSGVMGDQIQIVLQAGSQTNTATVIIVPFAGGGAREIFADLPTTASTFWPALRDAINMGQGSTRPPSAWVTASGASMSALAPLFGQFALAGGADGRSVSSSNLLGNPDIPSGIYTLSQTQFPSSVIWIAGLTDSSIYPSIAAFAFNTNCFAMLTFASGLDVPTVVSLKQAYGISDYHVGYIYGWVYLFDTFNNITRLCAPLAVASGTIATLAPEQSPFNKQVSLVIGTERDNPITGPGQFSYSEMAQLGQAGIMFFANPIPGANAFGFRNGYNSVGNKQANSVVEYSRLTNYLVQSNGNLLGQFEGRLQGTSPNDPLRAEVSAALNNFYSNLQQNNRIDSFVVICNATNNSPASVAAHTLRVSENVRYLSSVLDIFAQIQGGTTVQTIANQVAPTIPGS